VSAACEEVLDAARRARLSSEQEEHLRGCSSCSALMRWGGSLPSGASSRSGGLEAIRKVTLAELSRTPKLAPWSVTVARLVAAFTGLTILVVGVLNRQGWALDGARLRPVLAIALLLQGGMALALVGALLPGRRHLRLPALALSLVGGVALVLTGSGLPGTKPFLLGGLPCLATVLLASVPAALAGVLALRNLAFSALKAALVGVASGTVGVVAVLTHCNVGRANHLLVFHVLPWLALAGVIILVRRRLTTRSHAP
jgi:hypothetical protein